MSIRIGTRGSKLALAQANIVLSRLRTAHPPLQFGLVKIPTAGDRDQTTPLSAGEGAGWFTSALQAALLEGRADLAVHSYKDLPTKRPEGLIIAAVPAREDPRDALVAARKMTLKGLPPGAVVGTSSPRREAQLRAMRPDLEIRAIRGNVDTRIAKVDGGEYDAAVLALAGLRRLGIEGRATEIFGVYDMLPAPAQGALAIECRVDDAVTRRLISAIDDPRLRESVTAERSFLAAIDAGCSFPAAAYAEHFGSTLKLHALLAPGGRIVRSKMAGPAETAAGLGRSLAAELMTLAGM
ncbi:MAG TPA: hydroxymethylbilane synthase [Tepidiformaceae bacterium]|nr:hydroxymethylbilane synthase [Tepidiformaceae bacterium]